jgi:hypothetical protein
VLWLYLPCFPGKGADFVYEHVFALFVKGMKSLESAAPALPQPPTLPTPATVEAQEESRSQEDSERDRGRAEGIGSHFPGPQPKAASPSRIPPPPPPPPAGPLPGVNPGPNRASSRGPFPDSGKVGSAANSTAISSGGRSSSSFVSGKQGDRATGANLSGATSMNNHAGGGLNKRYGATAEVGFINSFVNLTSSLGAVEDLIIIEW